MDKDYKELIEYLDEKFQNTTTKEDLNNLSSKLVTLEEFDLLRKETKQELIALRGSIQNLTNSVDKLVKAVSDLKTEYVAVSNQLNRHEKWIQSLADKLGVKLEY
ncbi:hypothetical protein KAU51_02735 [Candidatus Parcubacteria bacterium]|nr:hypothetical protein [Candidatus Parcubacteria bacterium]